VLFGLGRGAIGIRLRDQPLQLRNARAAIGAGLELRADGVGRVRANRDGADDGAADANFRSFPTYMEEPVAGSTCIESRIRRLRLVSAAVSLLVRDILVDKRDRHASLADR
jgi:hypothetical protein